MLYSPCDPVQGPLAYILAANLILSLNFFFLPQFPILLQFSCLFVSYSKFLLDVMTYKTKIKYS